MKTLLRLSAAAALVLAVTACGEMPTAAKTDVAPARMQGGVIGGGGHLTLDGDTTTINTVSGDQTTTGTTCLDERGGGMGGGGYRTDVPTC